MPADLALTITIGDSSDGQDWICHMHIFPLDKPKRIGYTVYNNQPLPGQGNDREKRDEMLTITAVERNGEWVLVSPDRDAQEGFGYASKADAMSAAEQLWPKNSVWKGRKIGGGWGILIADDERAGAALGKIGGAKKSPAKSINSAANGKLGGRPRKS